MYSTIRVDKKTINRLQLLLVLLDERDRAKVVARLIEAEIAKLQAWAALASSADAAEGRNS